MTPTVKEFVAALREVRRPDERRATEQRIGPDDKTIGIRMRNLVRDGEGTRGAVVGFLEVHAAEPARVALRSAVEKPGPRDRARFMGD